MVLIEAGDQRCSQQRQEGVFGKVRVGQRHPPGAQPGQSDKAVSEEVAALADRAMNQIPLRIRDRPKERKRPKFPSGLSVAGR